MAYSDTAQLKATELCCIRGERELFRGLEFELTGGDILQIQGHNGSGKTSLLRILAGLVQAEDGEVTWNNELIGKSDNYFGQMHYIGHQTAIKSDLNALENLEFARNLKNSNDKDLFEIFDSLGLRGFEDIPCSNLSAGQKRRVGLARLFAGDCQLWILDEPFTALDVKGITNLKSEFLKHLQNNGIIIITTHQPLKSLKERLKAINPVDYSQEG